MNDILSKLPLFIDDDSLDEDFADYLDAVNSDLHKVIREKRYTVKDSDISYRVINHWDDKGLLPDGVQVDEEKWRKFSFIEIVWLEIIKELRSFGLSLECIVKIKDQTLSWSSKENTYPWFEYYVIKSMVGSLDSYLVFSSNGRSGLALSRSLESNKEFFTLHFIFSTATRRDVDVTRHLRCVSLPSQYYSF
jgi:DNA-binding transcriptional MerR regulator